MEQPLVAEIISILIEIFIYLFLLSLAIVFIARSQYEIRGAFYHLLLGVFISDLVFFIILSVGLFKLPGYGILTDYFKQNQWLGSFAYTLSVLLTIYQYLGQTLIAFNRFTCVWMPLQHARIWSTKWYIPILILLPIVCVAHRFTAAGIYDFKADGHIEVGYIDKEFEKFGLTVAAIIYGVNTAISAILGILTVLKHIQLRKEITVVATDKSVELLIYSLLLLFVQIIRVTYNRVRFLFVDNYIIISILVTFLQYIVDFHAAVASVAILILSPTTRKAYLNFYLRFLKKVIIKFQKQAPLRSARIEPRRSPTV